MYYGLLTSYRYAWDRTLPNCSRSSSADRHTDVNVPCVFALSDITFTLLVVKNTGEWLKYLVAGYYHRLGIHSKN